jgi:hypothetical protein
MEYYRNVKIAGEDVEEEMVTEPEAVPLDNILGYAEETRALYAGGLSEGEPTEELPPGVISFRSKLQEGRASVRPFVFS